MHPNEKLISDFYAAFAARDAETMSRSYSDAATFEDPVFQELDADHARAMWRMFCSGASVAVSHRDVEADDERGSATWEARYKFPGTGRAVHNVIDASFEFDNGRIVKHVDDFNFYRWTRMALGPVGLFLGWTSLVQDKVRTQARSQLDRYMGVDPEE